MCSSNDAPDREIPLATRDNEDEDTSAKGREIDPLDSLCNINRRKSVVTSALGMFGFYIIHDALQEQMFRIEGFEFGWFMTCGEVAIMILCGIAVESTLVIPEKTNSIIGCSLIGLCISLSHGFGNTALRYTMYPLKVAFKSCKLVPTMWMGFLVTGRKHSIGEYMAAGVMCCGLAILTLADYASQQSVPSSNENHYKRMVLGPILLALSTWFDSVVPNIQEKLFQVTHAKAAELMFLSNTFMFFISASWTLWNGELFEAFDFFSFSPHSGEAAGVLFLQGVCAYFGLKCYLTVIQHHGGVAGVLLANARKIFTIILSFTLFSKPCYSLHLMGLALVFCGVYFGYKAKFWKKKKNSSYPSLHRKESGGV